MQPIGLRGLVRGAIAAFERRTHAERRSIWNTRAKGKKLGDGANAHEYCQRGSYVHRTLTTPQALEIEG